MLFKELEALSNLRNVMLETVDEFLTYVGGEGVLPHFTQMLWVKI